jgi:hypothetical protein
MKLYDVPRGTYVKIISEDRVPPGGNSAVAGLVLKLRNIDGMYSYCTDEVGNVYHPAAWTEVEIWESWE